MKQALQYAIDAVSVGSLYALFGCGLALMLGVARIANFAYGDLMMVAAYALLVSHALPWPLVVLIVIVVGAALNLLLDQVGFRHLREADGMTLLVVAFGMSTLLQNGVLLAAGARSKSVNFGGSLGGSVQLAGLSVAKLDILTIGVTIALLGSLTLFLRRSIVGIQLRAASEDFTMSRLLGVRANRVIGTAFVISGAIAGVAAVLLTIQSGSLSTDMGVQPTLVAFIAVVLGGMGSLPGATLGGMVLGVISVVLQATLPGSLLPYQQAILFSLIIVVLLGRPQGILGSRAAPARV